MKIENGILISVSPEDIVNGTFTIPEGVTKIEDYAFRRLENLEKVIFPSTLKSIGENAFMNCTELQEINIPSSVTKIGKGAFCSCRRLTTITIPDSVKVLNENLFMNCISLKNITLPKTITSIESNTFYDCSSLENFEIPNGVKTIGSNAFSSCRKLKFVKMPESLIEIKNNAFSSCKNLEEINLPNGLKYIDDSVFHGCNNLKTAYMPDSVEKIGQNCFHSCHKLESIKLSNILQTIPDGAFCECNSLTTLIIPDSVKVLGKESIGKCNSLTNLKLSKNLTTIENDAIWACTALKKIEIPDSVTHLGESVFNCCYALEDVKLSNNITKINPLTFSNCRNLKSITIPDSVKEIYGQAFINCSALENIKLSDNIVSINEQCFKGCDSLKNIVMPKALSSLSHDVFDGCDSLKSIKFYDKLIGFFPKFGIGELKFFRKDEEGFSMLEERTSDSLPADYIKINIPFLVRNWDRKDQLFREQTNKKIAEFYNLFLSRIDIEKAQEFMDNHNFTFFKQFDYDDSVIRTRDSNFYKILYNLGAFNNPTTDKNGRPINYAQKVCMFLNQKTEQGYFEDITELGNFGENMEVNGFNQEFTDYFMKYFDEIHEQEYYKPGFFSRCYNEFDSVQKTNTNNHGSQRQLKPTFKKFVEYFNENKFSNITEETRGIADTISPYFSAQETFDKATKINEERINSNSPSHILSFHLKETPFSQIDDISNKIEDNQTMIANNLTYTANYEFTYDWLAKNDPENYILGKLCSCCAHIEGNGQGIMRASIIHPNIQNLVIRNNNGEIIAKSTLFINPEKGYGVFNNVEIYENTPKYQLPYIYEKYILGVKKFAEQYNLENPEKPLKILTVGMHLNDLSNEITKYNDESSILYPAINYSKYNLSGDGHIGDSARHQYKLWENSKEQKNITQNENPFEK